MSKPRPRTTRTVRLADGPLAGTTLQGQIGHSTLALELEDGNRAVYACAPHSPNGYVTMTHRATLTPKGEIVEGAVS